MAGVPTIDHGDDRSADSRTWYAFSALTAALLLLIYLLLSYQGLLSPDSPSLTLITDARDIVPAGVFLLVSAACALKATNLRIRNGILAFAAAALLFLAFGVATSLYPLTLNAVTSGISIADVLYILGSIALVIAVYLVRKGIPARKFDIMRVGLLTLGCLGLGGLIMLAFTAEFPGSALHLSAPGVAGIVLNLAALALTIDLLRASPGRRVVEAQVILATGVAMIAMANIASAVRTGQAVIEVKDLLYAIGYLFFAIAVWRCVVLTRQDIVNDRMANLQRKFIAK